MKTSDVKRTQVVCWALACHVRTFLLITHGWQPSRCWSSRNSWVNITSLRGQQ